MIARATGSLSRQPDDIGDGDRQVRQSTQCASKLGPVALVNIHLRLGRVLLLGADGDVSAGRRQVLGVMNDFLHMVSAGDGFEGSFIESSLWLADTPCSPLEMGSPIAATRALFDAPAPKLPPHLRLVPNEPETRPFPAAQSTEDALKAFKFCVEWDERSRAYLGTCLQNPELCHIDSSPGRALSGIRKLVQRAL